MAAIEKPELLARFRFDHVTIAGKEIDSAIKAFADWGIVAEYGGKHADGLTEMFAAPLSDGSYIEFIRALDSGHPSLPNHPWSRYLNGSPQVCALAIRVNNLADDIARFRASGIPVGGPEDSGRDKPDGTVLRWQIADVGGGARGSFFPFLIQDITPRELRVAASNPADTGPSGIARAIVGVLDLRRAVDLYRQAFGLQAPQIGFDSMFEAEAAWFHDLPLVLVQGRRSGSWLGQRVHQKGSGVCSFVLAYEGAFPPRTFQTESFGRQLMWADRGTFDWPFGFEYVGRT